MVWGDIAEYLLIQNYCMLIAVGIGKIATENVPEQTVAGCIAVEEVVGMLLQSKVGIDAEIRTKLDLGSQTMTCQETLVP